MAMLKKDNLEKYERALRGDGPKSDIMVALTHDFGSKENAHVALAYLSATSRSLTFDNRIKLLSAFGAGAGAGALLTLIIVTIVHIFA